VFLSYDDDEDSEITFGGVKDEHLASEMFWVNFDEAADYWQVHASDIALDKKPQNLCGVAGCKVAVDTGTSQLAGPTSLVLKLAPALDVQRDCSNFDKLPKLGFVVEGRVLSLYPEDYVDTSGGACVLSLMSLDVPPPKGPVFIFGVPFLQRYFTVYDLKHKRVGFAIAAHPGRGILKDDIALVDTMGAHQAEAVSPTSDATSATVTLKQVEISADGELLPAGM